MGKKSNKSSAVVVARLLSTEGFTPHLANQIERYWRTNTILSPRQSKQFKQLEEAIARLAAEKLDVADRLALGRFIGLHKKMSFDAGLRIGIQAFATKNDKEVEASQYEDKGI
jgi:hypothetical protein